MKALHCNFWLLTPPSFPQDHTPSVDKFFVYLYSNSSLTMKLPTPDPIDEASANKYLNLLNKEIERGVFGKVFSSSNDASELALKKVVFLKNMYFAEIEILSKSNKKLKKGAVFNV